jgi:hypothetical protein
MYFISILASLSLSPVSAHNFTPNESALFLSLVDQIESALSSIEVDLASDTDLAQQQAQYARMLLTDNITKELRERNERVANDIVNGLDSLQQVSTRNASDSVSRLNDLLSEAISIRIDKDQLRNATINALAFAEDIDKVLEQYTLAIKGENASLIKNMPMSMKMSAMNASSMSNTNDSMSMKMKDNETKETVKKLDAYKRASALTGIAIDRFNKELKGKSNDTSSLDQVAMGLEHLKTAIRNNASTTTIMGLVHGQIHPNLMTGFDLELAPSTNKNKGNMSMPMNDMSGHSM